MKEIDLSSLKNIEKMNTKRKQSKPLKKSFIEIILTALVFGVLFWSLLLLVFIFLAVINLFIGVDELLFSIHGVWFFPATILAWLCMTPTFHITKKSIIILPKIRPKIYIPICQDLEVKIIKVEYFKYPPKGIQWKRIRRIGKWHPIYILFITFKNKKVKLKKSVISGVYTHDQIDYFLRNLYLSGVRYEVKNLHIPVS